MTKLTELVNQFVNLIWGPPMLLLLVGGGLFFTVYAKLTPFRYFKHSIALLTGKYDDGQGQGDLSHKQALSAALAGTLGLGNVAGVAMAISAGGPGAIFWMWLTALLGVSTKFFTCTLGVMFRGKDSAGKVQGGPMYIVEQGLGKRWKPLALLFAVAGLMGTVPAFQVNQLTQVVKLQLFPALGVNEFAQFNLIFGIALAIFVGLVIWGGISRVADWATKLVPGMTMVYLVTTAVILFNHLTDLPSYLALIVTSAWQPSAAVGGLLGIIIIGVSRGAFSNEAGIGTEVMAHGAAKTDEPIREGLVASLGPIIDTLIICTCTALIILASGVWQQSTGMQGVELTLLAFEQELGLVGQVILAGLVLVLSFTTIFTYWYYGDKCFSYLLGADKSKYFKFFYLAMVVVGAILSLELIFNFMIGMYGLMAIPTMVSTLILAPKVMAASKVYFAKLE